MTVDPKWIRNPSDELAIAQGCYCDEDAGQLVCDFIETFCCQSKGKWSGQPIKLLAWQRDLLMRLFGWKQSDGLRRFRTCYIEVAKKNGKSTLVSAVVLYLLLADGEGGPEVYLNACDRSQARIVFDEAAKMVRASPELKRRLEVVDTRNRIVWKGGNGVILANSAVAPSKDGLNPSGTIFDELHRQPNSSLWDVFEHAAEAREQPLTISITTAGEDESGVWFEQRDRSERVNRGEIPDTTHLGIVYRALPEDDIDDPETWRKANPSLGETISLEGFARKLQEAKDNPRKMAGFKRLRLNIITKADTIFIDPDRWKACGGPKVDPAEHRGKPLFLGGDLSRTTDLTALVALWPDDDGGYDSAYWFFMPEDNVKALAERDRVPYQLWIDQGYIVATPGEVVDYDYFRDEVLGLAADHDLRSLFMDPAMAVQLAIQIRESDGLPLSFISQGFAAMNAPTKELERLVISRKIRHGNNPVMTWMMGNAIVDNDSGGRIKLSKKKSRLKIDGPAALVNAIAAATAGDDDGESVYDTRGVLVL
jgi:phage terminase large subunit-like protein